MYGSGIFPSVQKKMFVLGCISLFFIQFCFVRFSSFAVRVFFFVAGVVFVSFTWLRTEQQQCERNDKIDKRRTTAVAGKCVYRMRKSGLYTYLAHIRNLNNDDDDDFDVNFKFSLAVVFFPSLNASDVCMCVCAYFVRCVFECPHLSFYIRFIWFWVPIEKETRIALGFFFVCSLPHIFSSNDWIERDNLKWFSLIKIISLIEFLYTLHVVVYFGCRTIWTKRTLAWHDWNFHQIVDTLMDW